MIRTLIAVAMRRGAWSGFLLAGAIVACLAAGTRSVHAQADDDDDDVIQSVIASSCAGCHGPGLTGGDRAPALVNSAHLRTLSDIQIKAIIKSGAPGGMPAFPFTEKQIDGLAAFIRAQNTSALRERPPEQVASGEALFFGKAGCSGCHMVRGRGGVNGPDLSALAVRFNPAQIERFLDATPIGLTLDVGHLVIAGGDPVAAARDWAGRINHLHLKDVDRAVLARVLAGGGMPEVWSSGAFTALGRGDIDLAGVVRVALESGFDGWMVVEQDVLCNAAVDLSEFRQARAADQRASRELLASWL